ncbi:MAG: hypothetical protein ACOYXT_24780 [Bacteroidota bacterium]
MDKIGFIEIQISGARGNLSLTPDNFDIRELITVLESAEQLLFPNEKKDRPLISYKIEEGSVRHILKTSIQYVIGFNAVLGQVQENKTIDFLDLPTARAIEVFQNMAIRQAYTFLIKTSIPNSNQINISTDTKYFRSEEIWADAEFYFYGKITNAGGKDKANIHLNSEEFGVLLIDIPKDVLEKYESNILYRNFGVRARGMQHSETGEMDRSNLQFVEFIEYEPKYDESYIDNLRQRASSWLKNIDPDSWLREIRGGYE